MGKSWTRARQLMLGSKDCSASTMNSTFMALQLWNIQVELKTATWGSWGEEVAYKELKTLFPIAEIQLLKRTGNYKCGKHEES